MSDMDAQAVELSRVGEGYGYTHDLSLDFIKLHDPGLDLVQRGALPPFQVHLFEVMVPPINIPRRSLRPRLFSFPRLFPFAIIPPESLPHARRAYQWLLIAQEDGPKSHRWFIEGLDG
jgi:hypothetical protein